MMQHKLFPAVDQLVRVIYIKDEGVATVFGQVLEYSFFEGAITLPHSLFLDTADDAGVVEVKTWRIMGWQFAQNEA